MTDQPNNDFDLITGLQAGDIQQLGMLFDKYRLPVFRAALAITHDAAAAEDILQDTFLRLHATVARFDPQRPVLPWLYRVAINLSRTYVNRRRRWLAPLDDFLDRLTGPWLRRPERLVEHGDQRDALQQALQTLRFDQRVVLVLYYINEVPIAEIAEILNCPAGTVKSRLFHGRKNLRKLLVNDAAVAMGLEYELA